MTYNPPGRELFRTLSDRGALPGKIEFTKIGNHYFANSFDHASSPVIAQSVTTGFASSPDKALLISLVEFLERKGHAEAWRRKEPSALSSSTDGTAAFPVFADPVNAEKCARENAFKEALERYTWANWWDSNTIRHSLEVYDRKAVPASWSQDLISLIGSTVEVSEFFLISPEIYKHDSHRVLIVFAKIADGGFLSGGACETAECSSTAINRALAELARHALGLQRIKRDGLVPQTFYERRLAYFGLGHGDQLVHDRILAKGHVPTVLPKSQFDCAISHMHSDIVRIHRFLFENQPPFVSGALERLCL